MERPELLAPAGDWEAMRAAVANGADAVYFGLSNFNARHRAANFTLDELPQVMEFLHGRNVRGYVAFNTLIFSQELEDAARFVSTIAAAGVDAVIVQDLGLARLVNAMAPGLSLHGSTQMTLTEGRGIEFVRRIGVERVILARELSVAEIEAVGRQTEVPVEVFVHGALCVAYSGQCLTSEALGGRSANRGQCAQACRLPYEMVVDGEVRDLGERAYLLSPQDLAAYDLVLPLLKAGVISLKIEGRLKSAEYVAMTTRTYRNALDNALVDQGFDLDVQGRRELAQSFSRGLTHGFLDGVNHQQTVEGRFPKSRGVKVGTVVGRTSEGLRLSLEEGELDGLLHPGDGVVFDEGHPDQDEQGGRVYEVRPLASGRGEPAQVEITLGRGAVNLSAVASGALVWKTDDPRLRKTLQRSFASDKPAQRVSVDAALSGALGGALSLTLKDPSGHSATARWDGPLEAAHTHPTSADTIREQLGRLGDTPFRLGTVHLDVATGALVPKSVLNSLRRETAADLEKIREVAVKSRPVDQGALGRLRKASLDRRATTGPGAPVWSVLARTLEQVDAVLAHRPSPGTTGPAWILVDFEDVRRYPEAVSRARAAGVPVAVAGMRIVKPTEEGFMRTVAQAGADGVLVRNLGTLEFLRANYPALRLMGDFSLNVANELTAELLLESGLATLVPGYDLNWDQLVKMLLSCDPTVFEAVIHQHMPMFHMEHCVFAAFLSEGKDHRDCGRPCDRHKLELKDRVGSRFPVIADAGCRNTVYNSVAQSAAEYVGRLKDLGVRQFRVELLRESAAEVGALLDRYARVVAGLDDGHTTWKNLRVLNQLGVTRGTLAQE